MTEGIRQTSVPHFTEHVHFSWFFYIEFADVYFFFKKEKKKKLTLILYILICPGFFIRFSTFLIVKLH